MLTSLDVVLTAALGLSAESRAEIAQKLLASLDSPDRAAVDAAWAEEAVRRLAAYDRGTLQGVPVADVLKSLRRPQ